MYFRYFLLLLSFLVLSTVTVNLINTLSKTTGNTPVVHTNPDKNNSKIINKVEQNNSKVTKSKPKHTVKKIIKPKVYKKNSCRNYASYLESYSSKIIAEDFPYWYLMGQDYQESNCRFIISNDGIGSESPAQITWRWWKNYLKPYGVYNVRTIPNFTKAQVLIMNKLIKKAQSKGYKPLWVSFQAYNGGWLVLKEIKRAGTTKHNLVKYSCRRRVVHFGNGQSKSACDINYEYPVLIEKHTNRFYKDLIRKTNWSMW